MELRIFLLATLVAAAGASAAASHRPHVANFAQAQKVFGYQPRDAAVKDYETAWSDFNNEHHLDDKDGCWPKAGGPVVLIMELDASGKVVGFFADKDNARTKCWRKAYLGVTFPAPPFAPIYRRLEMP
jgi:hypothetical protein